MSFFSKKINFSVVLMLFLTQFSFGQFSKIKVQNEKAINSSELEFSPTFYKDGIVFISTNTVGMHKMLDDRIDKNTMSILRSRRSLDGALTKPVPFDVGLTTEFHEGPVCFSAATDKLYFSRNTVEKGKMKLAKDGELKMDIYSSSFKNGKWVEDPVLTINSKDFDDCHPVVNIDGDKLIFSSNREGGFGGMDLYVSYKSDDVWSEPVNLGSNINTTGNEVFPFLHADNTLYFASSGLPGAGGLDVFRADFDGLGWLKPANLGEPINTKGDDFGLILDLDKKNGYFASNGHGGIGQDDIFSFQLEKELSAHVSSALEKINLVVEVKNTQLEQISKAKVRIVNLDKSNIIGKDKAGKPLTLSLADGQVVLSSLPENAILEVEMDESGRFQAHIEPGNYLFAVSSTAVYESKQVAQSISEKTNLVEVILNTLSSDKVRVHTQLTDATNKTSLSGAKLLFTNLETKTEQTIYADEQGMVDVFLDKNVPYTVDAYKNGNKIGTTRVQTALEIGQGKNLVMDVNMQPFPIGTAIELPNIYYNFNDATLRPDNRQDLEKVVALANQYPNLIFELGSHTDARGTDVYNNELSQARAESVVDFLVENGVPKAQLRAVGYGERQLRNNCADGFPCDEIQHARNRRTEIKVIAGIDPTTKINYIEGTLGLGTNGAGIPTVASKAATSNTSINASTPKTKRVATQANASVFYVVVGTFLNAQNAENRLFELLKRGFNNAKMTQFNDSEFYYVFIEKSSYLDEAVARRNQFMQDTQEEAFVKTYAQPVE